MDGRDAERLLAWQAEEAEAYVAGAYAELLRFDFLEYKWPPNASCEGWCRRFPQQQQRLRQARCHLCASLQLNTQLLQAPVHSYVPLQTSPVCRLQMWRSGALRLS